MFKNKTIKLFLILGVILFSLFGVVGCSNPTVSDNVNATYIRTHFEDDEGNCEFKVVNNHIDLVSLLEDDAPEKYDDNFFETKSLLVFKIVESSGGNKSEIESYENIDKTLNVYVKTKQYGETCDMGYWWFILELNKEEFETFESIKIFKNGDEIMNCEKQIIQDYIRYAHSIGLEYVNEKNTKILENYGNFDDLYIIKINRSAFQVITYISFLDIGIEMQFPDSNTPLVYKNGNFYELKDAYKHGIITKDILFELQKKIEKNIILKHFDLTDEKNIWNGNINDPYILDDSVIVTLKKTNTYPELDLSVFGLDNAISMEYLDGITMPDNIAKPEKWRQKIIIYLKPEGKEKLLETIRIIEQLEFVKSVNPNWIYEGA